ncbi:MAG: cobalamin-dependent protein [Candidatus Muirbacterium halophilum]|nr:cobalamin-dependent protein [Candidatus Muirbacterium halophilum]MCK9475136.1 cobalamin-dependent protein [Candidatus Muirbacterium halophilum]
MNIRPYGDTLDDGAVQLSFTLPVKNNIKGEEAARLFTLKAGFKEAEVVYSTSLSEEFTFYIVYGKTDISIDYSNIQVKEATENFMDYYEVNDFIKKEIGRKLVIVGACTGSDAHTVGIDAIMNMKGYNFHYGLERYPMIDAYNLGAQVLNEELIEFAKKVKADAILISQVVTQKEVHVKNLTEFVEMIEAEGIRKDIIIIAGGPRISNKLALELGYDAGFGRGTYADHVATFVCEKIVERNRNK